MEHRMLRHKAIIQCARIAFGFSGITDEDEGRVIRGGEKVAKGREIARAEPLDPFRQVAAQGPDPVVTADWGADEQDYIDGNGGAE